MPSITKKQYIAWSSKMGNGFRLDLQRYCGWGEKSARLDVPTEDGGFWQVSISFQKESTYKLTDFGKDQLQRGVPYDQCNGWNVWTGNYYPEITIQHYTPSACVDGVYHSDSGWEHKQMGEAIPKRTFSVIQKMTHNINAEEMIKELFPNESNPGHAVKAA